MLGFINIYGYIYSVFVRGMNLNGFIFKDFVDILKNLWWRLDKFLLIEDIKYSVYCILMESLKFGVIIFFDYYVSLNFVEGSLFIIGDVVEEFGIRIFFCYEVFDRDGEEILNKGIKENIDYINYCKKKKSNMKFVMFGMYVSFILFDKFLNKCVE